MGLLVIGDEIHYKGYLVGLLVQSSCPATFLDAFVNELENGTLLEEADDPEPIVFAPDKDYEDALDDLMNLAQMRAQGGLLRVSDLANIIALLKETA